MDVSPLSAVDVLVVFHCMHFTLPGVVHVKCISRTAHGFGWTLVCLDVGIWLEGLREGS